MGVRPSRVRSPSAPEKEKEDDDDDEEEEEEEEEGLAATTDDDEETTTETPPASIPVLRAGDVEIEVTRDATVTVRALGDGRTRRAIRRRSLSASWFPASSATGSRRTGSATATCFVGGGSLAPSRVVAGCDDGDLVIETLPGGGDGDACDASSFTIERARTPAPSRGRRRRPVGWSPAETTASFAFGPSTKRRKERKDRTTERPPTGPSFARRCGITRSR